MPAASRSPLDDVNHLVVDGTNLLYKMGQGRAAPPAAVVGRLRAAIPGTVMIEVVFDGVGHGVSGRVAQQMFVRWSGRRSGDAVVLELAGATPAATANVLVVTDDYDLRVQLAARGARTAPLSWILHRLSIPILASPAPGNRRPPIGTGQPTGAGGAAGANASGDGEDERPGWKPGRGATSKTGPAHKVARHRRHPRHP